MYYAVYFKCETVLVIEWLMLSLDSQENWNIYGNIISKKVTREEDLC